MWMRTCVKSLNHSLNPTRKLPPLPKLTPQAILPNHLCLAPEHNALSHAAPNVLFLVHAVAPMGKRRNVEKFVLSLLLLRLQVLTQCAPQRWKWKRLWMKLWLLRKLLITASSCPLPKRSLRINLIQGKVGSRLEGEKECHLPYPTCPKLILIPNQRRRTLLNDSNSLNNQTLVIYTLLRLYSVWSSKLPSHIPSSFRPSFRKICWAFWRNISSCLLGERGNRCCWARSLMFQVFYSLIHQECPSPHPARCEINPNLLRLSPCPTFVKLLGYQH